jgi:alpha-L-arabinofuranosidase
MDKLKAENKMNNSEKLQKITTITENFYTAIQALAKVAAEMEESGDSFKSSVEEIKKTIGDLVVSEEMVSNKISPMKSDSEDLKNWTLWFSHKTKFSEGVKMIATNSTVADMTLEKANKFKPADEYTFHRIEQITDNN